MVCILSQSYCEESTEDVIRWLGQMSVPCLRLNADDLMTASLNVSTSNRGTSVGLSIDGREISLNSIKSVWFRKWSTTPLKRRPEVFVIEEDATFENLASVDHHLRDELVTLSQFLFSQITGARWLGSYESASCNKLEVLCKAAAAGLEIPRTFITNTVQGLADLQKSEPRLITKPIGEVVLCERGATLYMSYTNPVPERCMWSGGFPSLFQEAIEKDVEIRTFYMDGKFYHGAMFSQRCKATATDFRVYQPNRPTRVVPFRVPKQTEEQIDTLMRNLGLRTGSIDMIRKPNGQMVFLEVNPVGQYGMVAGPCNYPISKDIATTLAQGCGVN